MNASFSAKVPILAKPLALLAEWVSKWIENLIDKVIKTNDNRHAFK
jgi:hypothetical protein